MLRRLGRLLHELAALCHLLLFALVLCALRRAWMLAAVCSLAVGFGGLGAAWSRQTDAGDGQNWLTFGGGFHRPSRSVLSCALEHAPFAVLGLALLCWSLRWRTSAAR